MEASSENYFTFRQNNSFFILNKTAKCATSSTIKISCVLFDKINLEVVTRHLSGKLTSANNNLWQEKYFL